MYKLELSTLLIKTSRSEAGCGPVYLPFALDLKYSNHDPWDTAQTRSGLLC
jgi:hypothetical protein